MCLVTIAASASKTVYLVPGPWNADGARYALYMFNSDSDNAWVSFTDADGDGTFTAELSDSYASMILCRMNGTSTENSWSNKWGQTGNITAPVVDGLTFTITSNDSDNSGYTISGDTYLYNVGANAYLQNGASWGTHAALKSSGAKVTVTAGDGVYTIHNDGEKSGYFNSNGYVDSSTDNWTFESVSGANAYKLKTSGGSYAYSASGMYNVKIGSDPGTNMAYWRFVTATKRDDVNGATNLTPVELTHKITNPRFDDNADGWQDAPARGGNTGGTNGDVDSYDDRNPCAEHYNKTYDTYQTISNLPNGTYAVSVQGFYREGGYAAAAPKHVAGTESLNAIFYANTEEQPLMSIFEEAGKASGGNTKTADGIDGAFPDNMAAASYFFSTGLYWNTVYVIVTDGTLKIGIKKSTAVSADWTIFDNFRLQYFGTCSIAEAQNGALIVAYNEALANAQTLAAKAMEANAKSALNSVIDANDDLDASTASAEKLTAATTALNDAVLAAQPSADLYAEIRTLLDGLKTQDATFDAETKYNAGTYTAIDEVYSEYYAFAIAKLGTEANTDFTQAIINPSFEFGNTSGWTYKPSNDHGAKTYAMTGKDGNYLFNNWSAGYPITQTITGLPKGLYELKAVVANSSDGDPAKVYLLANDVHEGITCDTNGDTGVEGSVKVVVTDAGTLTIGAVGSNNDADRSYSEVGVWWYKADNFRLTYLGDVVSDEDAAALLATVPEGKMNANIETALNSAKTAFEASKTTDNYQALQTAIENANACITAYTAAKTAIDAAKDIQENTNVVTAAAATTFAEAIAAIETPYTDGTLTTDAANAAGTTLGVVVSGWHGNANGAAGKYMESAWDNAENFADYYINTWSNEGASDGSNFVVPFFEYWTSDANSLGAKTMTATQENLAPNGIYTVSIWARARQANSKTKVAGSITMQVGEGTAVDMTAGTQIGSSQFYLDTFTATGQADANGKLTIKINVAAESNISWLSFKNVKYTEVESASSDDYVDLAAAITAAEAKTLGFEAGEYAPYNNVAAIEALAAAKAIDQAAVNAKADVEAATTALTTATWTVNEAEMNAFYKGDFADYTEDTTTPLDYTPAGWTASVNFRMMLKNTETYPGLNDASAKSAVMAWSGGITYGETAGFEMPLKPNSVYRLSFKAAGWNNESRSGINVSVLNSEDGLAATDLGTPNRDIKGNESNTAGMTSYVKFFKTGAAGNYVFHVQSGNNMVLTDFDLRQAPVYAVVGSDKDEENAVIFSDKWDQATQTDIMTFEDGVFTKTYADQVLDAQTIAFKVIEKASVEATTADVWHGDSNGNNVEMVLPEANTYDITITFDGLNVSYTFVPATETFTVGEIGWATAVTHYAVDFTGVDGLKAYTATVAEGTVTLAEAGAVPAGTALVLKGATKAVPVVESADAVENDLKGSNEYDYVINDEMAAQYTFYGLTVKNSKAQFVKLNNGTIQPGKAYLQIEKNASGDARELKVVFAGEATGIDAIVAEQSVEGIYNMNGQRVAAPAKGLYIVNGKKVMIK